MAPTPHELDQLAAFVEGRLPESQRHRVTAHVAECLECRRVLAELARATVEGTLPQATESTSPGRSAWSYTRVWVPLAASVLIGTFAWFQFAGLPDRPGSSVQAPQPGEDVLRMRSGGRTVAGKIFRFTSGEWVDTSVDPGAGLPVVIVQGAEERRTVLERLPQLQPYADLGDRVVVAWQGRVYRFEP